MSSYFDYFSFSRAKKNKEALEKTNPKTPVLNDEDEQFLHKITSEEAPAPPLPDRPIAISDDGQAKEADSAQDGSASQALPISPSPVEEEKEEKKADGAEIQSTAEQGGPEARKQAAEDGQLDVAQEIDQEQPNVGAAVKDFEAKDGAETEGTKKDEQLAEEHGDGSDITAEEKASAEKQNKHEEEELGENKATPAKRTWASYIPPIPLPSIRSKSPRPGTDAATKDKKSSAEVAKEDKSSAEGIKDEKPAVELAQDEKPAEEAAKDEKPAEEPAKDVKLSEEATDEEKPSEQTGDSQPEEASTDDRKTDASPAEEVKTDAASAEEVETEGASTEETKNDAAPAQETPATGEEMAAEKTAGEKSTEEEPTKDEEKTEEPKEKADEVKQETTSDEKAAQTSPRTWASYIPALPAMPTMPSMTSSKGKEKAEDPILNEDGSVNEEATQERDEKEVSVLLDNLNLSAINNRVFSFSKESEKIYEDFTIVLKDIVNGGPTAYSDLEDLIKNNEKHLDQMFGNMPPFVKTLVKSLPAKFATSLGPEIMAAASEKPGNDMQAKMAAASAPSSSSSVGTSSTNKKQKRKVPSAKSLVTEKGAVASMLRSILNFLKLRFPAVMTGTNVLMSLSVFILLFVFWYCHKRGKETRLLKEKKTSDPEKGTVTEESESDEGESDEDTIEEGVEVLAKEEDASASEVQESVEQTDSAPVTEPKKEEAAEPSAKDAAEDDAEEAEKEKAEPQAQEESEVEGEKEVEEAQAEEIEQPHAEATEDTKAEKASAEAEK